VPIYAFHYATGLGFIAVGLQIIFSVRKDIRRIKDLRYGAARERPCPAKGRQFTKAVAGNGIGITTNDSKLPLRIPREPRINIS
jgi:hypothetical protein